MLKSDSLTEPRRDKGQGTSEGTAMLSDAPRDAARPCALRLGPSGHCGTLPSTAAHGRERSVVM